MTKISSFICLLIFTLGSPVWGQETNSESNEESAEQDSMQEVKEIKYVTDKLRLSLYKKPDSNSGTIKLLTSGDVLSVLERSGPYSKVTTVDNKTGWVKNGFLVSIPTASFLLIEEKKKTDELTDQLDKFSNTQKIINDYEDTIQKMNSDTELTIQELSAVKLELEEMGSKNSDLNQQIEDYSQQNGQLNLLDIINFVKLYWYIALAIIFILFMTGYLMGKAVVQARVRKRFQGVKVL